MIFNYKKNKNLILILINLKKINQHLINNLVYKIIIIIKVLLEIEVYKKDNI